MNNGGTTAAANDCYLVYLVKISLPCRVMQSRYSTALWRMRTSDALPNSAGASITRNPDPAGAVGEGNWGAVSSTSGFTAGKIS